MTVLVLGGTGEGRALAGALVAQGVPVVSSLAGATAAPRLPAGEVRVGGFGGVDGLASYLREHDVAAVVDATHPFAARMSVNAAGACARARVPLVRLARPGWGARPDAAGWTWVTSPADAARAAHDELGRRGGAALLAVGRETLVDYALGGLESDAVLGRVTQPPAGALPPSWELLLERGPFTLDGELRLFAARPVTVVVTKDSGGDATSAKLDAAAQVGAAVVVLRRPDPVPGVPEVHTVADATAWVLAQTGRTG